MPENPEGRKRRTARTGLGLLILVGVVVGAGFRLTDGTRPKVEVLGEALQKAAPAITPGQAAPVPGSTAFGISGSLTQVFTRGTSGPLDLVFEPTPSTSPSG